MQIAALSSYGSRRTTDPDDLNRGEMSDEKWVVCCDTIVRQTHQEHVQS